MAARFQTGSEAVEKLPEMLVELQTYAVNDDPTAACYRFVTFTDQLFESHSFVDEHQVAIRTFGDETLELYPLLDRPYPSVHDAFIGGASQAYCAIVAALAPESGSTTHSGHNSGIDGEQFLSKWPAAKATIVQLKLPDEHLHRAHLQKERAWVARKLETTESKQGGKRPNSKKGMTPEQAEKALRKLAKHEPTVRSWSCHRLGIAVGCSAATVRKTKFWKEIAAAQGRSRTKGTRPQTVSFSSRVESVHSSGTAESVLDELAVVEDIEKAREQVLQSGLGRVEKEALLAKLETGRTTPQQACGIAEMYPPENDRQDCARTRAHNAHK